MFSGLASGFLWALNSVVLGIVMSMSPFISTEQAIFLAPFISTFLNDFFSSMYMFIYSAIKKQTKKVFKITFSKAGLWIVIASLIGGPIGMTGYVLSISYMGSSIASVASAIYPAIGVLCARLFLKEKMRWYQYLCLVLTMLGIYGMSYSPNVEITNFLLGLLGTAMCAIGWGLEAVLIGKGLKNDEVSSDIALHIRQTISWLTYAIVILPCLQYFNAWSFTISLFNFSITKWLISLIMLAGLFGTASYLFYYKAINNIGATKALPLNVTYVAWTIIINLILFQNVKDYNWLSYLSMVVVFVSSIFAAIDVSQLRRKKDV
jgi:drug/metabolite transporter (DMT)-like permease